MERNELISGNIEALQASDTADRLEKQGRVHLSHYARE